MKHLKTYEEYEHGKDKVAGKSVTPSRIVYHLSDIKNRESILQNGLKISVGDSYGSWSGGKKAIPAIFATDDSLNVVTGGVAMSDMDIWVIDTWKIDNEWFEDNHFNGMPFKNKHIVTFTDIPSSALKIFKQ